MKQNRIKDAVKKRYEIHGSLSDKDSHYFLYGLILAGGKYIKSEDYIIYKPSKKFLIKYLIDFLRLNSITFEYNGIFYIYPKGSKNSIAKAFHKYSKRISPTKITHYLARRVHVLGLYFLWLDKGKLKNGKVILQVDLDCLNRLESAIYARFNFNPTVKDNLIYLDSVPFFYTVLVYLSISNTQLINNE